MEQSTYPLKRAHYSGGFMLRVDCLAHCLCGCEVRFLPHCMCVCEKEEMYVFVSIGLESRGLSDENRLMA